MKDRKTYFGINRVMIDRIDSLDEKWFVEFWIVKYYFLGIEIHSKKKEIVKTLRSQKNNLNNTSASYALH
jgi:hypothetical protein